MRIAESQLTLGSSRRGGATWSRPSDWDAKRCRSTGSPGIPADGCAASWTRCGVRVRERAGRHRVPRAAHRWYDSGEQDCLIGAQREEGQGPAARLGLNVLMQRRPLLKSRGINLSESQVYRLVTGTPERIPARTQSAKRDSKGLRPAHPGAPSQRAAASKVSAGRAVEGDRGIRCVPAHKVDDALEQAEQVLGLADATADDDHLPRPAVERLGHDRLDVVAPVEPEQAGFDPDPGVGETSHADGDRVGHGCGVPSPGHPVRVEPDHQDPWLESGGVHPSKDSSAAGIPAPGSMPPRYSRLTNCRPYQLRGAPVQQRSGYSG